LVLLLCGLFFIIGWLIGENMMKTTLTGIALAVAAIPEALPAVITVSLALAANKMIRFNCLIRKLPAVETLGSVTYICTDKTGTLTKNQMHVESVFVNNRTDKQSKYKLGQDDEQRNLLLQAFALNNDVVFDNNLPKGDSTEIALLKAAQEQNIQTDNWPRIEEIPFDSERKLMTTFHKHNDKIISFTKGAPDILIPRCDKSDGEESLNRVKEMAEKGYRVLGFAYRYWDVLPEMPNSESHETNLHFLGLAGLIDPPRDEVFDSIAQCKTAGIVPVMITGDHPLTAKVIAQRIGILSNESDLVLTGQEFATSDDESLFANIEKIKVYARVSPEQKLKIVNMLQKKGHYVAMTGDGVNDAPALKKADIGIAMGTGTDVSKEAADMVILDDDFSTMIKAVQEGRRVYDNILKFIKYIMSTNASELLTLLLGPMIGLPVALLPIHILWLNLTSDGLPAISLSFENAEKDIMNRPPRPPKQSVFSDGRGIHMIWVGILMAGVALFLQGWAIKNGSPWQTMVFNFLCLGQLGHVMAVRSEKQSGFGMKMFSNKLLITAGLLTLLLQFTVTFIPFLQPIFKTESLTFKEFVIVGLASLLIYVVVEARKMISNKYKIR